MKLPGFLSDETGVVHLLPLLIVVAVVGIIGFILVSSVAPFSRQPLSGIYTKPNSQAAIENPILNDAPPTRSSASDQIIVKYKGSTTSSLADTIRARVLARINQRLSVQVQKSLAHLNADVIKVPSTQTGQAISQFKADPEVQYAEVDSVASVAFVPNDQLYPNQWELQKMAAPSAWNITKGSSNVLIAIVDTGIDASYRDDVLKIAGRVNLTTEPDSDTNGHGTAVANIAAANTNNIYGMASVGFNTKVLSVKVLDINGSGFYSTIAQGITWAADNGAKVISLSLSGTTPSQTLQDAVNYAWNKGAVVVAASGNDNNTDPHYPAFYTPAISVAATDQNDARASFSNYGTWVDVAAPGVSITAPCQKNPNCLWSGTSMSTPLVAGVAALVFAQHPSWTNAQVKSKIEQSADKISGTGSSWINGRVNACGALDCTVTQTPAPTPSPVPTVQPTQIPTPFPVPTFAPTATPMPTPKPTPFPTAAQTAFPQPSNMPTPVPTQNPNNTKPWYCSFMPSMPGC